MKNKELVHRIVIMIAMIFLLIVATVAWFVNDVTSGTAPADFVPANVDIAAYLQEIDENGVPVSPEGEHGLPFDENGMADISIENLVPGETKIYRVTAINGPDDITAELSLGGISLSEYDVTQDGITTKELSEIDKFILFKLDKAVKDGVPNTDFAPDASSIFTLRDGGDSIPGVSFDIAANGTAYYYGIFKYDPAAETFSDGSMLLHFGIAGTLK